MFKKEKKNPVLEIEQELVKNKYLISRTTEDGIFETSEKIMFEVIEKIYNEGIKSVKGKNFQFYVMYGIAGLIIGMGIGAIIVMKYLPK